MRTLKKLGMILLFILPAIMGIVGYIITDKSFLDAAYLAVRMYFFDVDTFDNNFLVEISRWVAPVLTVSGLIIILKKVFTKVVDFFAGFLSDAVAIYGDNELKKIAKKNIKHSINVDDNEVMDVTSHIIMFSTDEQGLEFYKKNKDKLKGEVFIKLDKNDSFSVGLDNVKFFNPCEIVARNFWQKNDIRQVIKTDEMKIAIVGSDILSRKILTYGLLNNIYTLTQKIEYEIWSDNDCFRNLHGDFETANGDTIKYCDIKSTEMFFRIAEADRIIFTGAVDNEILSELTKLTKGEIYCYDPLGTFVNIFDYEKIYAFGQLEKVLTAENIRTDDLYKFAKELNYRYALKYLKEDVKEPTLESAWNSLDEFTKGSNVASTDYHKIMLIVMRETNKKKVDYTLGELEHIRWCRYHYINHWRFGETQNGRKDVKNKIHPCLKPFCELSEGDKNKDIEGIETLLSLEGI